MRMRSAGLTPLAIPQNDTACEIEQPDSLLPAFAFRFGCLASFSFVRFHCASALLPRTIDLGYDSLFQKSFLPRKEVIQPHLPIRLPCYDFTPVIDLTFGGWPLAVTSPTSGAPDSHGVTGGVYKARERIHRGMLIRDY
jgi:hypothetical protein